MAEDSQPCQLGGPTDGRELIALGLTDIVVEDEHFSYQRALELCRLLLSGGYPESVTDLSSRCTHFQASPELVKFLCSIPNSPISLAEDRCTVTLSCKFLSTPANFACSLGLPENVLIEQIRYFMDSTSSKSKRNGLWHMRGNEEQEELQLMPLSKRSRMDENDVNCCSVMDNRANDITTISHGSMLEALVAFESQASRFILSTQDQKIVACDHNPRSGPSTQIFGCEIFGNASVDVDPMHYLEESKQDSPSQQVAGICEQLDIGDFQIADNQILFEDGEDKSRKDHLPKEEIHTPCVPATSLMPSESELRSVQIFEDIEDMIVLRSNSLKQEDQDGEDKNRKDLLPKVEIHTPCVPATSLMPSESELRSVQIVEDTKDMLALRSNSLKQEDQDGEDNNRKDLLTKEEIHTPCVPATSLMPSESELRSVQIVDTEGMLALRSNSLKQEDQDGEDNNRKDLLTKEEIHTLCVPATSLMPSESELRSVQVVEDTEDMLSLRSNSLKQEDQAVDIIRSPVRELPLKPSATTANQDKYLVQKTQDLCKFSGNIKACSCSPEEKHIRKSKTTQNSKQNLNPIRPKDQKDQSKHNTFPDFDSYTIVEEEGSGGYGIVYKAKRKTDGSEFAIKCPHAGAQKHYVNNEIRMLEHFGGKNFIIKHEGCLKIGDSDCIILEHLEHDRPDSLKKEIDVYQLQFYGYCMFKALASLHKQGVVHRDVKPGNFLFSRKTNKGYLIDFNLAMDLHQKYKRAVSSNLPTASKNHHTLVKSPDKTNRVTNKSSHKALAPNSLKKAVGNIRARNDMSRWERFNSQGAEGSGLAWAKDVTCSRNNPLGEKRREPLPCHGRKALLNFLQTTMSGPVPNHEVSSKAPTSIRKRVAALPGKAEKEHLYLTPMPLRSNGQPEAGNVNRKKDGLCSGTKGFRAPEVCFRSLHQGPKLDVWSAGVTLLYLMMGRTPFTGDPEQNIKDIAQLRGSEELWEVAKLHNRESSFPEELYESRYLKGIELRKWCEVNTKRRDFLDAIPWSLFDLVDKCLTVNPRLRISAEDALKHDFFHPIHRNRRLVKQQMQSQPSVLADAVGKTLN